MKARSERSAGFLLLVVKTEVKFHFCYLCRTMDDLITSFKATLYDRITSPLLSSFLISWAAWNHRLGFALLSDLPLYEKFAYIDEILYPRWDSVLLKGFLYPLIAALVMLYIYPLPARRVYQYVLSEQKRLRNIKRTADDETPISAGEARTLRARLRDADEQHDRKLAEREQQIKDLRDELAVIRQRAQQKEATNDPAPVQEVQLSDLQHSILESIASDGEFVYEFQLRNQLNGDRIEIKHALDQLEDEGFIEELSTTNGPAYEMTPEGRAHYIRWVRNRVESANR